MTEWGVVGVIIALVGLVVSIVKPMLTLNTSITKLTLSLEALNKYVAEQNSENKKAHERLWSQVDQNKEKILNHEGRIINLERHKNTGK